MRIWEFVGSTADAVKRNLPDATPVKDKRGSAKIDRCVRITGLRRGAAEGVDKINVTSSCADGTASFTKMGQAGQTSGKSVFTYGFMTFVKIGYTVRVKGFFYRLVHWIANDGTKSVTCVDTTNTAQNAELYESKDGDELNIGQLISEVLKFTASGAHESLKDERHGFSSGAHESLKDEGGFPAMKELLVPIMIEFTALMSQFHKNGVTTKESLLFMMREFCVFMMKQVLRSQLSRQTKEAVVVIMRLLFRTEFCKDLGLNEPETKGNKKKKKKKKKKKNKGK